MFQTSPLMYSILILGMLFSIVIGFVALMVQIWNHREKKDGIRRVPPGGAGDPRR